MSCAFVGLIKTIKMHSTCIKILLIPQREHNPSPLDRQLVDIVGLQGNIFYLLRESYRTYKYSGWRSRMF